MAFSWGNVAKGAALGSVFGPVGTQVGGVAGAAGLLNGPSNRPQMPDLPDVPEIDPRLKRATEAKWKHAEDFRKGLPGQVQTEFNMKQSGLRSDLAKQMAGVKAPMAQRGLLYSGLRQAGEARVAGRLPGELANLETGIKERGEERAGQFEEGALQSGLALQQLEQERNNAVMQRALAKAGIQQEQNKSAMAEKQGGIGGLVGGLGTAIGGMFGRR